MDRLDLDLNPRIAAGVTRGEPLSFKISFRFKLRKYFKVILPNIVSSENKTA